MMQMMSFYRFSYCLTRLKKKEPFEQWWQLQFVSLLSNLLTVCIYVFCFFAVSQTLKVNGFKFVCCCNFRQKKNTLLDANFTIFTVNTRNSHYCVNKNIYSCFENKKKDDKIKTEIVYIEPITKRQISIKEMIHKTKENLQFVE